MNNKTLKCISILLLLLGLSAPHLVVAAKVVEVLSADPGSATPSTNLNVTIGGKGFDRTAKVKFLKTATEDPGGITVETITVLGSSEIIANITVSASAALDQEYDIAVTQSRGRGGKGTTLFKVQSSNKPPDNATKCYVEDSEDTDDTVPSTIMGDGIRLYTDGLDIVNCGIGDVVKDNLSPIRFRTLQGGSIANAIRFLNLDFTGKCTDVEAGGCAALPENFFEPSLLDTAQLNTRAITETFEDHIYEMPAGGPVMTGPIGIDVQGYVERYAIQMRGVPEAQHSTLCLNIEDFDLVANSDPYYGINIYAWNDRDEDQYPDGYTISTGVISNDELETDSGLPTVTASSSPVKRALVCSNIGPNGEPCNKRKQRNALCHTLGIVDMHFTMHVVLP